MNGVLRVGSRRLPEELMSEVFLNYLEPDDIGCVVPSSDTAPLKLSWVCRHWRRICLSTPQLWTGINLRDVTEDGMLAKNRRALAALLDLWITRSGSCPISIKFSYLDLSDEERGDMVLFLPENNEDSVYVQDVQTLINKLLLCRNRWRVLDMAVLDLSVVEPLLKAISALPASPVLEHLSILTQYLGIFGEIRSYNLALSPKLRTIRILSPLIVPEANGMQFEQLEELDLKYCTSMSACLQWLDKAPNLKTLNVRLFTAGWEELQNETCIRRLDKLHTLRVSSFSVGTDPAALINLLELPALADLSVDTNDLIDSRSWTCILDLLKRSRPLALEVLTLLGTPMNSEDIMECLRMSPRLTYLNLGGEVSDDILHALSAPTLQLSQTEAPLCPALKVLELTDVDNCSPESLVRFITSRSRQGSKARTGESAKQYRTLETLIIPHDADHAFTRHSDILSCLKERLNIVDQAPVYEVLPAISP